MKNAPSLLVSSVQTVLLLVGTITVITSSSSAFVVHHQQTTTSLSITSSLSPLFAKTSSSAKKKKKKPSAATTSSMGGFGKASSTPAVSKQQSDDYAAFPPLEPSVADTLLKSPEPLLESGCLTDEVYQRLEQIYGFPDFNYDDVKKKKHVATQQQEDTDTGVVSFDDLIASATGGSTTESSSSSNLGDLLGGSTSSASKTQQSPSSPATSSIDAISKLPPFQEFRILHMDPLVIAVDDFFTHEECQRYIDLVTTPSKKNAENAPFQTRSKTVGKDAQAKAQRTSTTWFNSYKTVPELMAKASRLLGLDTIDRWEEPQIVR
jgi:hypothetical protein